MTFTDIFHCLLNITAPVILKYHINISNCLLWTWLCCREKWQISRKPTQIWPKTTCVSSNRGAFPGGVCGRRSQRWRLHGGDDEESGSRPRRGHDPQPEAKRLGSVPSDYLILIHDLTWVSQSVGSFYRLRFLLRLNRFNMIPVCLGDWHISYVWSLKEWHICTLNGMTQSAFADCSLSLFNDGDRSQGHLGMRDDLSDGPLTLRHPEA